MADASPSRRTSGEEAEPEEPEPEEGGVARMRVIAGLVALAMGVIGLVAIVGLSLLLKPAGSVAQIVSAAVSAIGSIVAAYFGIKLGNDNTAAQQQQTQQAVEAQREEATKAQAFAAVLDPEEGRRVLRDLNLPGAGRGGAEPRANA